MNRIYALLLFIITICSQQLSSQQVIQHQFSIPWSSGEDLRFDHAGEYPDDPRLPVYTYRFPLTGNAILDVVLSSAQSESVDLVNYNPALQLPKTQFIGGVAEQERGKWYGRIWFMPVSREGSTFRKIQSGTITITVTPVSNGISRSGPDFKQTSVLSIGTIHRISVTQRGIYKIDYAFIKDKLNVDPATLSPDRIALFGNGSGRIPQWNNAPRIDDLEEVLMHGVGTDDGHIDQGDYFLWYAEGPDSWTYDHTERIYHLDKNIYDESNHYYVILDGVTRSTMTTRANGSTADYTSSTSLVSQRLEEEKVNLLGRYRTPGSGQEWYGDELAVIEEIDYSDRFDLNNIVAEDTISYKVRFAARSSAATRFYIGFDGREFNRSVGGVDLGNFEASFGNDAIIQGSFRSTDPVNEIYVRYPDANGINSRAWLDYIEFNAWKENRYSIGSPVYLRDPRTVYKGIPQYYLTGFSETGLIWDITNPMNPVHQQFQPGTTASFIVANDPSAAPREFVAFNSSDAFTPVYDKVVANQNLHQISRADLVIIYFDDFESAAMQLAAHRRSHNQMEVVAVPVSLVFEEFGGGSADPSAIRDFARMIYTRDPSFRYLLFIGDATYDYLNRFKEVPFENFIPAFETEESLDPIRSFPTDDFYALLDPEEGNTLKGAIDIAVGRLPVSSEEEATAMVAKIIHYDSHPSVLSDWRQRVVMVADDQDGNTHLNQADGLAVKKSLDHPELNIYKIYLDAYTQESTPGGDRYPAVNDDLDLNINKGALTVTYLGHGGQNGWTQERVLGINQAQSYNNLDNMPLFITATCSFAGYDEPSFTTAGEHLLTNPSGGAIALMTTVRAVYSGSNERLTRNVLDLIYEPDGPGNYPGIAEVLRRSKNVGLDSIDVNARKFTLLGDPSLKLGIPRYSVGVTEVNGKPAGESADTLSALEKSRVSGVILGDNGEILTSFNGRITLTVFDKVVVRKTLANDSEGNDISVERAFNEQTKQLFKGLATVSNGHWTIEFVLPKDIDFSYGNGKMSFYAEDGVTDAGGYFNSFIIGGVSSEGLADDEPPVIQLYMNDDNFVSGGITNQDPDIYAVLMDDFGINVSGTGVGHDLEAVLDNDDKNSFILNDFYRATLDDYRKGEVRYPLKDLAPGKHTLKLTAWDLANNPGEAYLEFLVLDREDGVLEHVLNYPNPFTTSTNFQFEHNRAGVEMDIQVHIYTISGVLVKTLERQLHVAGGNRVDDLWWDGLDDSGNQLAKGVYVYRIKVAYHINGSKEIVESNAEKLVILR